MSIHPRDLERSAEQRMWSRIGDLSREVSRLRRAATGQVQRGYSTQTGTLTGVTAGVAAPVSTGAEVTVNIPSDQYRVLLYAVADIWCSTNTTSVTLTVMDGIDFTANQLAIGTAVNQITPTTIAPWVPNQSIGGTQTFQGQGYPIFAYNFVSPGSGGTPFAPTPGDHTFKLAIARSAGAGTCSAQNGKLWVAVV